MKKIQMILVAFMMVMNVMAQESADLYIIHSNHEDERYSSCFKALVNLIGMEQQFTLEADTYIHIKIPLSGIQIASTVFSVCDPFPPIVDGTTTIRITKLAPENFHRGFIPQLGDTFYYILKEDDNGVTNYYGELLLSKKEIKKIKEEIKNGIYQFKGSYNLTKQ